MARIRIAGAGLAGSAAAIAAARHGAKARLWDPSRVPRQRVCGEFLTPETLPVLEKLGLASRFHELGPARMTRARLVFGDRSAESRLPEVALGLSRRRLDLLLRDTAEESGAHWISERVPGETDIVATGRRAQPPTGDRLFGFKAHYTGPSDDSVALHFLPGMYAGVNPIEEGRTNVCGLAAESTLKQHGFDFDALMGSHAVLRERLEPLRRETDWLSTGPVVFHSQIASPPSSTLLAGDALQFIDPFTGSGMGVALWSGMLAGECAALGRPVPEYYATVRSALSRQYRVCAWLRNLVERRWPLRAAPWVSPAWLFELTRPQFESR